MEYITILLYLILLVIIYEVFGLRRSKKEGLVAYIFSGLILVLFAGLRFRVGIDTLNYMELHYYMPEVGDIFEPYVVFLNREFGWILLTAVAKLFDDSFYSVQIIVAFIVNTCILIFIYQNTQFKFTGILMYYIIFYVYLNFEIMRESIAIALFLAFGYQNLLKRRWLNYVLVCILCFLFHTSSFFLFLLPFLFKFVQNISKKEILLIPSALFVLGLLFKPFFIKILLNYSVGSLVNSRIELYSEYGFSFWGNLVAFISFILFPRILVYFLDIRFDTLRNLLITYCYVGALVGTFTIFYRLLNYFTPFLVLATTELLHQILKSKMEYFKFRKFTLAFLIFLVFFNYKLFLPALKGFDIPWYVRWYPYYSILDEQTDPDREYIFNN